MGAALDRIVPCAPKAVRRRVLGADYLDISIFDPVGKKTWRKAERLAGELCTNVVVPWDLDLPEDSSISRFTGEDRFFPELVLQTTVEALNLSRAPLFRRTVGLLDPRGVYQKMALTLTRHCAAVRILTGEPGRYRRFCEQMMEIYGAPVGILREGSAMEECLLVAAPDGLSKQEAATIRATVLSARACPIKPKGMVISALEIAAPKEMVGNLPKGISPTQMAAALFELEGIAAFGSVPAQRGRVDGGSITISELAKGVRSRALAT